MKHPEITDSARHAFDHYPKVEASAAFNRAVLEQLELENARRKTTILGRLEDALGLSLWRFAASGMLGAFVPGALLLGAMCLNRSESPIQPPAPPLQVRALGPFYAREWEWARENASSTKRFRRRNNRAIPAQTDLEGGVSCVDSQFPLA